MKVLLQWAVNGPADWTEVDSSNWSGLPKKKDPVGGEILNGKPGWINRVCVQGVEFTADHYAVEDLPGSGCRVYAWSDDPEDYLEGFRNAKVCEFLYLDYDPNMNGAINTHQTITFYAESEVKALMPDSIQNGSVKNWTEFNIPPEEIIRHGVWLPEDLYQRHERVRRTHGWREWSEGLDSKELDHRGHVKEQRKQGRYIVPSGTRTYYHNDVARATSVHNVVDERALGNAAAGASSVTSQFFKGGDQLLAFVATSPLNQPDAASWPSGQYRCQIDCTSIGLDITYGLRTFGTAAGHFGRVNSALTTEVATRAQVESAFAGTGLKLATYTGTWSGSTQTDRFEILIAGQRAANHGNQTITLQLGETDDFADGPWAAAGAAASNAPFFGTNF